MAVFSSMAGHDDAGVVTGHIGTNTPKISYPLAGGDRAFRAHVIHKGETPFSEPLLRTLLRTLFYCKSHSRPPSQIRRV